MNMTDERMRESKCNRVVWLSILVALIICGSASAASAQSTAAAKDDKANPAENYFTDTVLVNQDGKQMRFYNDLLKDKVVIINTFFTTCTSVCPPMARTLERIQGLLGDRMGKDVRIISVSVDPETDTPPRLKDFGRKFNAKPGWYLVSGKKQNVDFVLRKLGQFVEAKDDHSTILIIGNLRTGLWKKAMGLAKVDELFKIVESVLNDNPETAK
jgi:protein SCO1/2